MTKITRKAVYRPRNCETCSASFLSRSSKKRFCDVCSADRERAADRFRAAAKLRAAGARPLGGQVACANCGADFQLVSGPMRFCDPCSKDRLNRWHRNKRACDPKSNLSERMRRAMNASLATGKQGRSWRALVPYSLATLADHLERQFPKGMTWENRGGWEIDHIVPVAAFEFESPDCPEFQAAWALTNLRPIWTTENRKKSARRTHLL